MTLFIRPMEKIVESGFFRYFILGAIMNSMQESHQEMEREKRSMDPQSENFEGILLELDRKIDAVKNDLSKLKDVIRQQSS